MEKEEFYNQVMKEKVTLGHVSWVSPQYIGDSLLLTFLDGPLKGVIAEISAENFDAYN